MKKTRKYGTRKTTSREGKSEYMLPYMRDYRKKQTELLRRARREFGIPNGRKVKHGGK